MHLCFSTASLGGHCLEDLIKKEDSDGAESTLTTCTPEPVGAELSTIALYVCITSSLSIPLSMDIYVTALCWLL